MLCPVGNPWKLLSGARRGNRYHVAFPQPAAGAVTSDQGLPEIVGRLRDRRREMRALPAYAPPQWLAAAEAGDQAMQRTAGRCEVTLDFMKRFPMFVTLSHH